MTARPSDPILEIDSAANDAEHFYEAIWFMFGHLSAGQETPLTEAIQHALSELGERISRVQSARDHLIAQGKTRGELKVAA